MRSGATAKAPPDHGPIADSRSLASSGRVVVRDHPAAAFFILSFLISWTYWLADIGAGGHWSHFPGLLGPAVAAVVVSGLTGRLPRLTASARKVAVPFGWYAAALLPLAVAAVVLMVGLVAGGGVEPGLSRMDGVPDL